MKMSKDPTIPPAFALNMIKPPAAPVEKQDGGDDGGGGGDGGDNPPPPPPMQPGDGGGGFNPMLLLQLLQSMILVVVCYRSSAHVVAVTVMAQQSRPVAVNPNPLLGLMSGITINPATLLQILQNSKLRRNIMDFLETWRCDALCSDPCGCASSTSGGAIWTVD